MPRQNPVDSVETRLQILIVDDDARMVAAFARSVLGVPRLRVLAATSTATALELATRSPPDVALVDLVLGRESGVALIARLRRAHPAMRIAAMTAAASRAYVDEALAAGAEVLLQKPFTLSMAAHALGLEHDELRRAYKLSHASLELAQWEHVRRVHSDLGGNILRTARVLQVSRTTVRNWLSKSRPPA